MINDLIAISPSYINYANIILVPMRPKRLSQQKFIINQIQVFGFSQFTKISGLYISRKFLNAISYKQYSVAKVAKNNRISVLKTDSLKSEEFLKKVRTLSLDIILSVASSRLFGSSLLSIPKLGCLNVHAGMLPRYRGINPSFWSLLNQEKQSAVTVHYINEEIDDGEIIQQDIFDIQGIHSLHSVYLKVQEIAPKTIVKALVCIKEGNIRTIKNERSSSTYFSFPTKEDGRKFRAMGLDFM
jgi:methionyl-tRNA formyltransferase